MKQEAGTLRRLKNELELVGENGISSFVFIARSGYESYQNLAGRPDTLILRDVQANDRDHNQ